MLEKLRAKIRAAQAYDETPIGMKDVREAWNGSDATYPLYESWTVIGVWVNGEPVSTAMVSGTRDVILEADLPDGFEGGWAQYVWAPQADALRIGEEQMARAAGVR